MVPAMLLRFFIVVAATASSLLASCLSAPLVASIVPPVQLNVDIAVEGRINDHPQVATDGQGRWVSVWRSQNDAGSSILCSTSSDDGATWSTSAVLSPSTNNSLGDQLPQIVAGGHGQWLAVWQSYDRMGGPANSGTNILIARSSDGGARWTAAAALKTNFATESGDDYAPQIATDGNGHWVSVWESFDRLGGMLARGPHALFAASADNGLTWSAPAALNSAASEDACGELFPQIATDAQGNWVALWIRDH